MYTTIAEKHLGKFFRVVVETYETADYSSIYVMIVDDRGANLTKKFFDTVDEAVDYYNTITAVAQCKTLVA